MAQQAFGYKPQKLGYGYVQPQQQPRQRLPQMSSLAQAAAGKTATSQDPFGLLSQPGKPLADGYFSPPARQAQTGPPAAAPATPVVSAASQAQPAQAPQQPTAPVYDINTDPALQQAQSLIGMNDEQAKAEALKQQQQLLLAYGDPTLAAAVLGQNDPTVQAAGQNQTSTLSQLKQQHDQGVPGLVDAFNKENLLYSGARVKGEQQYEQNYLNTLAQAAAGANQGLSGISAALAAALASGNQQRVQALLDAYNAQKLTGGVDPGAAGAAGGNTGLSAPGTPQTAEDYLTALLLAAKTNQSVAV